MGRSFWNGVRALFYAFRHCDDREHFECDNGHEYPLSEMGRFDRDHYVEGRTECGVCGGELKVRVERPLMVRLAIQDIRSSLFPYRLHEFDAEKPETATTWYWRGRKIYSRLRPNPFLDLC